MRSIACLTTVAALAAAGAAVAQNQPTQSQTSPAWSASRTQAAPEGLRAPDGRAATTVTVISSTPVVHPTDGQMDGRRGRWSGSSAPMLRTMTESARVPEPGAVRTDSNPVNSSPAQRLAAPGVATDGRPISRAAPVNSSSADPMDPARTTPPIATPDPADGEADGTEPRPNPAPQ